MLRWLGNLCCLVELPRQRIADLIARHIGFSTSYHKNEAAAAPIDDKMIYDCSNSLMIQSERVSIQQVINCIFMLRG